MTKLIMLGSGHAMVTKCYNTCFAIQNESGTVLVDAGGGNGILTQMERAEVDWSSIKALFLTHAHTDHILGGIWVIRKINSLMKQGIYQGDFTIYGLQDGLCFLEKSCQFLLSDKLNNKIHFIAVKNEDEFSVIKMHFKVFDIGSTKMPQIGFRLSIPKADNNLSETTSLVCLGDEPFHEKCLNYAKDADWLLSEAFCLHKDRDTFHPYEKHHSTALDAGIVAKKLGVRNLILYHTEDTDLQNRKKNYHEEAATHFDGAIYVPDDLETIILN